MRLIKRLVAEQLEQDRISVTDYWALTWIGDGETSPTALGRTLAVTPAGMTQLLDRLEKRRLIRRSRNPGDRRATVLELTLEGRQLQRRAGIRCTRFLEEFAADLTPTGLAALEKVSRELDAVLARRSGESSRAA
jgi:MarR family transcriptional regulator, transcriptional regulator for hemolysin